MFFYLEKVPLTGTIVVANIADDEENDTCMYCTLPEYNNARGILYKSQLPKRVKDQRKAIIDMKQAGQIVCVVSITPKIESDGQIELIELSIKGVDAKHHPNIIARQKNIKKILKIVKFVSLKYDYDFDDLVEHLQTHKITPLMEIDETPDDDEADSKTLGVDPYTELYLNYLRNHNTLLEQICIKDEDFDKISKEMSNMIKETNASMTLDFDLFVWKAQNDAIFVMRDMFNHVQKTYMDQGIDFRYLGAPTYQLIFSQIDINTVNTTLQSVKDTMNSFMIKNMVTGYDLRFEISKKNVKRGEITIHYDNEPELYR